MNRSEMISRIEDGKQWDILIIGGGATGIGTALDAASRGYKTLLLEQGDFGQGTSSRSTKLIHGGVRYLQQGNLSLVLEALKERGILRRNAPHLVHNLPFIVPNYDWWEGPFYGIGLKIYDMLAGREGFGDSRIISREETVRHIPTVEQDGLNGGVIYYDGQFDDARLVVSLARTAAEQGAVLVNYLPVSSLIKKDGFIRGVVCSDLISGREFQLNTRAVINACGPFSDNILKKDDSRWPGLISHSQGVHLVLDRSFLPGDSAIMVPHTDDGRILFAIPWHNRIIIGTTDTPVKECPVEPLALPDEISFLIEHAARYLEKDPTESDVLSVFAGIRPLIREQSAATTAAISREHVVHISKSGLVTIAGGKWTTYRKMAEDTVDQAIMVGQLEYVRCQTEDIQIHGYHNHAEKYGDLAAYGSDAIGIANLVRTNPGLERRLSPDFSTMAAEVVWAVREEMALTVADFLCRRTRSILMDVQAAVAMAPAVAVLMKDEMGQDEGWASDQIDQFRRLAENYLIQ